MKEILKKNTFSTLIIITLFSSFLTISSCNNDKNEDEPEAIKKNIVGKWQCDYDAYGDLWDEPLIYLFDNEGTGYEWFMEEPFSDRYEFNYIATSSKLKIKYKDGYSCDVRYEIEHNGESLIIYGLDDNDMSELWFTRIK